MKRKLRTAVSALLSCVLAAQFALPVQAREPRRITYAYDPPRSMMEEREQKFLNKYGMTMETDSFRYVIGFYESVLETTLVNENVFVVLGTHGSRGKMIFPFNCRGASPGYLSGYVDEHELQVGDLIYLGDYYGALTLFPPIYFPEGDEFAEQLNGEREPVMHAQFLGNGMEIFGEEFAQVVRHEALARTDLYRGDEEFDQMLEDMAAAGLALKGDLTGDDETSIVDVVAANKHIMLGEPLSGYATIAGDVDGDGMVNETDSLAILKHILRVETF